MLARFCLYGFLKNQQYYELFWLLALRQRGISFAAFGILIAIREITIILLEVPTGAVADVLGRRRSMVASMVAYMGAFALLATARPIALLAAAMVLFAVGETLRTGTHKAIIFDWLARRGRAADKTAVYGHTRSWSQIGSAVSVVLAGGIVFLTRDYAVVFWWCLIPYTVNLVNLWTYPRELDSRHADGRGLRDVGRTLLAALGAAWRRRPLRRALLESMTFEGHFKATRDYVQPILAAAAAGAGLLAGLDAGPQRTAVLAAAVGLPMFLAAALASRGSPRLADRAGGERPAAARLWGAYLLAFGLMAAGAALGGGWMMIAAFVVIVLIQNLWLPIAAARVAGHAPPDQTATVLSIKSQVKSLWVAVAAPLIGWSVDAFAGAGPWQKFLPLAAVGVVVAAVALATWPRAGYDSPPNGHEGNRP